jgi:2-polyprenyl-3-methyl-5-hydroxy-6-metoxy-1,4-benzoquinol methylase
MREIENCPICFSKEKFLKYASTLLGPVSLDKIPNPYSAHYQINECSGCALILSSPILEDEKITALYRDFSEKNVSDGEEENVRQTMKMYYNLVRPHLYQRERILDVGCDVGYLLEVAYKDGFRELHGLEPVPATREIAQKIPGSAILDEFYESTNYPKASFDLITLIHVLDHLVDPSIVLKKAITDLKSKGLIVAVVHNVESLLGRIMGEKFPVFNLYHHYFFSKKTLRNLFEAHGYEVIKVVSTCNRYSLGFFLRRMPGLPNFFRNFLLSFFKGIKLLDLPISIPVGNIGIVARKR